MRLPRGLTEAEESAWARLAASVDPLDGRVVPQARVSPSSVSGPASASAPKPANRPPPTARLAPTQPPPRTARRIGHATLDRSWDRKLKAGSITPDYTLDLHDHFVDAAYARLDSGMHQARAMGARLVLVITGRPRPVEAADRGARRGVIRAKILDWLAAGDHADAIAAIRAAHRRHGGEGALYLILRRDR